MKTICTFQMRELGPLTDSATPCVANRYPSSLPVPDAQSPDPSSTSPAAAQKGHQAHKTIRYGRCICGGRVQGQ